MKKNRTDGTGWDWAWADFRRDWMEATPNKYAYRCLPLTIVNQTGWIIRNPVGFTACGTATPGRARSTSGSTTTRVLEAVGQQPVRRGHHHLEHAVPVPHPPAGSRLLVMGPTNTSRRTPTL